MPYYRKRKKGSLTRRKRRWKPKSRAGTVIVPGRILADATIVKMRYHENISIDPATGLAGSYIFRANSVFDPNFTGTGHQPLGHDEWTNFYNRYCVLGSRMTAIFSSQTTVVSSGSALVGISLKNTTVTEPDLNTLIESKKATTRMMTTSGARQSVTVRKNFSMKKHFQVTSAAADTGLYEAALGSGNPTEQAYYHVFIAPTSSSYDVAATTVSVLIEYIVKLSDCKSLTGS